MSNVENLQIGEISYPIRDANTFRSLTTTQETQLITDGTYNGEEVESGEVFTSVKGKFVEFKKEQSTGVESGAYTGGTAAFGYFNNKCFSMANVNSNMYLYLSDDGKNWTSSGLTNEYTGQIPMVTPTRAVIFNSHSGYTTVTGLKTTNGTDWASTTVNFPSPGFLQGGVFYNLDGKVIFVDDYGATTNYFVSTDDGDTWVAHSYPDGFQGAAGQNNKFALLGDKLYLVSGSGQLFETSDGLNWTLKGTTSITRDGSVVGDYYMYESGRVLYYSTDMLTTSSKTFPLSDTDGRGFAYSNGVYAVYNKSHVSLSTDNLATFSAPIEYNTNYAYSTGAYATPKFIQCFGFPFGSGTTYYGYIATVPVSSLKDLSGVGTGTNAPTSSTEGYIGKLYVTDGGAVYICTGVSGSTYTWAQITTS